MGKTVLITGAAQRIGRHLSIELAQLGYNIIVHYHTSHDEAQQLVRELQSMGVQALAVSANLMVEEEVQGVFPTIQKQFGPVDILINNASTFTYDGVDTVTRESWDHHMEANLRAPFILSQQFARQVNEGCIINILDQRVWNLTPHYISYTLSKVGLWTLTQTLALALAPRIRVNAIGPGPTLKNEWQTEDAFRYQCNLIPMKKAVSLKDVSNSVQFLIQNSSITGQMIAVDGGQHLGWSFPENLKRRED
jgi:NAD(P)-dependent dehydrogenase (short-subunit alcohol dehydrogenase family)